MPEPIDPLAKLPKYRHYKPKDLAVVRIDGRDVYLGRYDSPESREKYRRVLAEWLAGSPVGPPARGAADTDSPSVNEVILAFWRFAELHYRHTDGSPTEELASFRRTLRPLKEL